MGVNETARRNGAFLWNEPPRAMPLRARSPALVEDRFPGFGRAQIGYRHCACALTRGGWTVHLGGVDQPRQTADRGGRQAGEERVWVARICVDAGLQAAASAEGAFVVATRQEPQVQAMAMILTAELSNMTPLSGFVLRRGWRFGVFWSRCA